MAARSRAIEARLERLAPSVEEFYVAGILSAEEKVEVARSRLRHEYKLIARPLLLIDVQQALDFELHLERKVSRYVTRNKLQLQYRWSILDRIEAIYRNSIPRLRDAERVALEDDFVAFMLKHDRTSGLSKYVAEQVSKFPQVDRYWCLAAQCEARLGNVDHARATIQRAIELIPASTDVWTSALRVELDFAKVSLDRIKEDDANEGQKADVLARENSSLGSILLDLALCKAVIETGLSSGAWPEICVNFVGCCAEYKFSKDLVTWTVRAAAARLGRGSIPKECEAFWQGVYLALQLIRDVSLSSVASFIENRPEEERKFRAIDVFCTAACRYPSSRKAFAKALIDAVDVNEFVDRYSRGDWAPVEDTALLDELVPVDCLRHVTADTTSDGRALLERAGLLQATRDHILVDSLRAASAVSPQEVFHVSKSSPPKALAEWKAFEIVCAAAASAHKARRPCDSDEDTDDLQASPVAVVGEALKFLRSFPITKMGKQEQAEHERGLISVGRLALRAAKAEATSEELDKNFEGDDGKLRNVVALTRFVDHISVLVHDLIATTTLASPFLDTIVPALAGMAKTPGVPKSLQSRLIQLVRNCYEVAIKSRRDAARDYAEFEVAVARRPDLAARVRARV